MTRLLNAVILTVGWGLLPVGVAAGQSTDPAAGGAAATPPIAWQEGPGEGALGDLARIQIPEGYVFAGAADTRSLLEAMENPTNGTEQGFLKPIDANWFVVFEYDDSGHVKDDEKDEIDADALLASLRAGNDAANEERTRRGWSTLEIVDWMQPPRYDAASHNLEWATRARASDGGESMNFNTRLLGRTGVMRVTLVGDPAELGGALPQFRTVLGGYEFSTGQRYAEYRSGDRLAEYGLTALIAGGVGAAAMKSGLLAKAWKFIAVAAVAVGAAVKRLFGGRKSEA